MVGSEAQESKDDKEMIVYNIEDFVVNQMFRPYRSVIVEEKFQTEEEYKKIEKELRKDPLKIMWVLRNNKEAYKCVLGRLAKMNITFYKWLNHPIIGEIEAIIIAFRYAEVKE